MPARSSPCKINLLLNILGRRADGFHELETVMHPVRLCDELTFESATAGVTLTCSDPALAVDATNLVHRAATSFLAAARISQGVRIHLEKRIPMAAGLGGGSGDAATTLLGLNELFDSPLSAARLHELAAALGSDIRSSCNRSPRWPPGAANEYSPSISSPFFRTSFSSSSIPASASPPPGLTNNWPISPPR